MTCPMKPFIPSQGIYWLMTLQTQLRSFSLALVGAAMMLTSVSIAQSYRGQRAGNISPRGRVQECNHAGAIIQKLNDEIFQDLDGGACVLNGARFDENFVDELKENKQYGGLKIVDFSGMDLRNSSWVAVFFDKDLRPVFRDSDASGANFSAMHGTPSKRDGMALRGVDATNFIATKTLWQGNVMKEWFLRGADFSDASLSSSELINWMTDDESYANPSGQEISMLPEADSGDRQLNMSGSRLYNCTIKDCKLPGTNFSDAEIELTTILGTKKKTILNGSSFEEAYLEYTDFLNVNLSGALMTKVRMENCEFESTILAGASLAEAELTDCKFNQDCDFNGISFEDARLTGVDFDGADLRNANLSGCTTRGLKGKLPQLPEDCEIKIDLKINRDTAGVATDTLKLGTYSIVVNAGRFSNGVREKGN